MYMCEKWNNDIKKQKNEKTIWTRNQFNEKNKKTTTIIPIYCSTYHKYSMNKEINNNQMNLNDM